MNLYLSVYAAAVTAFAFLLTVSLLRVLIPVLKSHKIGQKINEIGPRWHKNKEGTPIMGGVAFIVPAFILMLLYAVTAPIFGRFAKALPVILASALAFLNGAIGFADDYIKLIKKRNKGLSVLQKLVLQFAVAAGYVAACALLGLSGTRLELPFSGASVELGFFYYVFSAVLIVGIVNSVNLTDGVDGLASSVCCVYGLLFLVFAMIKVNPGITAASGAIVGGCAGFLVYNFYPARIFMGDTGSLYLGGMAVGLAFAAGEPLIVLIAGLIFVVEAASVILQVLYFKITHGKRLFRMSPIHHHFEKCGWSEKKIVFVFAAFTLVCCIAAWFGL